VLGRSRTLFFLALALTACAPIPVVEFVTEDASIPRVDASGALDAGERHAPDATVYDAGSPVEDASVDATREPADAGSSPPSGICPTSLPEGTSYCCNVTPCRGTPDACAAECTNCENNCGAQTCCMDHNGNYEGCASSAATCRDP